jgi:hypothetical protein
MSTYPANKNTAIQSLNYLLSGPAGLGQNFSGFSTSTVGYLTGNDRTPYTQLTFANTYVPPINLSTSQMLNGNTFQFTFSSTQSTAPFALGQGIYVQGVSDSFYNRSYTPVGVVECTTDYVIARTLGTRSIEANSTGGNVEFGITQPASTPIIFYRTDCNETVQVTGVTDRVFISAQLNNTISYIAYSDSVIQYTVQIARYFNSSTGQQIVQGPVATRTYTSNTLSTGTGTIPNIESIFTSIIDSPGIGQYFYVLQVAFNVLSGSADVTTCLLGVRSFTAQVVKQ